jgi:hypothetical protein
MATITRVTTVHLDRAEWFEATLPYRTRPVTLTVHTVTRDGESLVVQGRSERDGYMNIRLSFAAHQEAVADLAGSLFRVEPTAFGALML